MPYCLVVDCLTGSKKVPLKPYQWLQIPDESTPQSKKLRKKWLEVCNRDFIPSEHTRICSKHFKETDFIPEDENLTKTKEPKKKKKLKPTAVPSLFLKNPKPVMGRPTKNSNNEDSPQTSTSFANEKVLIKDDSNENAHNNSDAMIENEEKKEPRAIDILRSFMSDEESDTEMAEPEPQNNEQSEIVNHDHMCLWVPPKEPKRKVKICHLFSKRLHSTLNQL